MSQRSFLPLRPLRIAQIPPLYESVSPKLYGGTERIVAYFWPKRLVRRGHDVTLYAAGDSTANVRLAAGSCQSLRLIGLADFGPMFHLPMLSDVYDHAGEFDVIHSHVDCLSFPLTRMVHRANGLDYAWSTRPERLPPIYRSYSDLPVGSISNDQRRPLPEMNWIRTVYHGLPRDLLKLVLEPPYLAFSEGFPRRSVPISPLRSRDVQACHSRSPRRLVMIEALAWGAPVIARLCGSVPEILRHGITGLIGSSLDELVAAVGKIGELSRQTCRQEFEARFTAEVMAANYEDVYYQLADSDWSLRRHQSTARSKRPAWRRSAGPLRGAPMAPGRQPRSVEVRL